jgi:cytoskeletal protein CcmA (bactofilin family)
VNTLGKSVIIRGEVRSSEDLVIEGRVEGPIWCEGTTLTLAASGQVAGDVIARDITVFGRMDGQLVATEVVDLRPAASITGRIVSKQLIMHDGAEFNGRVEPQHLQAALGVARYQQQKRDGTGRR